MAIAGLVYSRSWRNAVLVLSPLYPHQRLLSLMPLYPHHYLLSGKHCHHNTRAIAEKANCRE